MPVFMGKHKLSEDTTEEQMQEGWEKYKAAARARGLKPLHANYSLENGFAYCEAEAPSAQDVREAHEVSAIPLEDVVEVVTVD